MADVTFSGAISAASTLAVDVKRYRVSSCEWAGDLPAGSTLEIDGENLSFKLDGALSMADAYGEIPDLLPGVNEISYEDTEGARTILLMVQRRERTE